MSSPSFFFYDLETSGFNPRADRIMQFAGQRTDMNLQPVGDPVNVLVALTDDVLPSPDAIMVTGIAPQKTKTEGLTEAEFLQLFTHEVSTPGTIFVGYNSIRFDDEFMRFLHYRNFYDPYEWQWKDDRGRWDLLDVVRMTRALRPEGIEWPFDSEGKPTNRLEYLSKVNGLEHANAHDALSDVEAVIGLAKLLRAKQPKLFDYLLGIRHKKAVAQLVDDNKPFVYSSGKYESQYEKTTIAMKLADHPDKKGILVYDLRYNPEAFMNMTVEELVQAWTYKKDATEPRLPLKTLQFNRCPAVAPLGVLDDDSQKRLSLNLAEIEKNRQLLQKNTQDFVAKLHQAIKIMDKARQESWLADERTVDAKLYDGFFGEQDRTKMSVVRAASASELSSLDVNFSDKRLQAMLPLYKARNFPQSLSDEERSFWDSFKKQQLTAGREPKIKKYFARLEQLSAQSSLSKQQQFLVEELRLYGESLMPSL